MSKLKRVNSILFSLYFILVTIFTTTTNSIHYSINKITILVTVSCLLLIFIYLFFSLVKKNKLQVSVYKYFGFITVIYSFGFLLSFSYGGYEFFLNSYDLILFILISYLFNFVIYTTFINNRFSGCFGYLLFYFILVAIIVSVVGSLNFGIPPYIDFSLGLDGIRRYSQGFTSFFSMGVIFVFTLCSCKYKSRKKICYLLFPLLLVFLLFVLLGGGRGEFLVLLLVLLVIQLKNNSPLSSAVFFVSLIILGIYLWASFDVLEGIKVFDRLSKLNESGLGERELKYFSAFYLVGNRPDCIILGCGFNFYLFYNNYEIHIYPHNIIVEIIITYGLMGAGILLFSLYGIFKSFREWGGGNPIFYCMVFKLLTFLKSGSLFSFTSLPFLLFFCFLGLVYAGLIKSKSTFFS